MSVNFNKSWLGQKVIIFRQVCYISCSEWESLYPIGVRVVSVTLRDRGFKVEFHVLTSSTNNMTFGLNFPQECLATVECGTKPASLQWCLAVESRFQTQCSTTDARCSLSSQLQTNAHGTHGVLLARYNSFGMAEHHKQFRNLLWQCRTRKDDIKCFSSRGGYMCSSRAELPTVRDMILV